MNRPHNRWPWAAAALIAVAALVWFMRPAGHVDASTAPGTHTAAPGAGHEVAPVPAPAAASAARQAAPSATDSARMEAFVAQWATCDASADACKDNPLAASSYKEAVWLNQHGYPTAQQLADYEVTPTAYLRAAAATGNLAARALYGRRLIADGDYRAGMSQLFDASEAGGYYALYELSEVYASPEHSAGFETFSYLRLAYLLGDAKAGRYLAQLLDARGGASLFEMRMIDDRAAELRKNAYGTTPAVPRP